jgi:hydrogenase maturation protease
MRVLLIAAGNSLRRDDGAAHRVLELLAGLPGSETRSMLQFTPELAQETVGFDSVIFIDADATANVVTIEPVERSAGPSVFSHASKPAEIVALARALFGFEGQALVCRIPACDLSPGEGLSRRTAKLAALAARRVAHTF